VIDVATGARAEKQRELAAQRLPQFLLQIVRIIGGVLRAPYGVQVQGEIDQAGQGFVAVGRTEQDDADRWIDRAGGANDVRIQHAGIETHRPILHVKAAVEGKPLLLSNAGLHTHRTDR